MVFVVMVVPITIPVIVIVVVVVPMAMSMRMGVVAGGSLRREATRKRPLYDLREGRMNMDRIPDVEYRPRSSLHRYDDLLNE